MVDVSLIKDTIRELLEANVDKDTIYMTLKEIGVDQEDIDKYYADATAPKPKPAPQTIAREPSETGSETVKSNSTENTRAQPNTTTEELQNATNDVINTTPVLEKEEVAPVRIVEVENYGPEIKKQISDLESQITDIKAQLNGLTKIMKDILDENRNILNKMK